VWVLTALSCGFHRPSPYPGHYPPSGGYVEEAYDPTDPLRYGQQPNYQVTDGPHVTHASRLQGAPRGLAGMTPGVCLVMAGEGRPLRPN
jgi:hypothetical protein